MKHCVIIGISDSRHQWFPPKVMEIISNASVFSGGKRHREIMTELLPRENTWIDITVPLSGVFQKYEQYDDIVIFASGDPLFFGFANTVQRECPEFEMEVYPSFNSLQMLAHRMLLPYQEMHIVSLTGRPWERFDEALIMQYPLIGVLTDRRKTPEIILRRMYEYGYDNYEATIGENLGNEESERITRLTLRQVSGKECETSGFEVPNCMILRQTSVRSHQYGIPDSEFHLLNGRAKMITKMPIRLVTLAMLELGSKQNFWDIGFCTGSISIEAKLQFPRIHVTSFEIREEGRELMKQNSRKFGAPGIEYHIGDFTDDTLFPLEGEHCDAVFIGGHGGKLREMIAKVYDHLEEGGVIVFNSVSESSRQMFLSGIESVGMTLESSHTIALDDYNPITILKSRKTK